MKKIIFCFMVLLVSASMANAQSPITGIYSGTASNVYMGHSVSGTYSASTTFSNNDMTALSMSISGHSVSITTPPKLKYNSNSGTYIYDSTSNGAGVVTVPYGGGATYGFDVVSIELSLTSTGVTYTFEAYIEDLGMTISFTFTA